MAQVSHIHAAEQVQSIEVHCRKCLLLFRLKVTRNPHNINTQAAACHNSAPPDNIPTTFPAGILLWA